MTQTTTAFPPHNLHPADVMLNLVAALLAPMFLLASGGDIAFARMAALETVAAYRVSNQASLLAVAQIVAFGLAAMGSLSLSMADDLSLSMTLRLRSNANALNRSAEQNRRALENTSHNPPDASQTTPIDEAAIIAAVAAARQAAAEAQAQAQARTAAPKPVQPPTPAPTPRPASVITSEQEQHHRAMWASAIADVAGEFTASLPHLPPAERNLAARKAAVMSTSVAALLSGDPLPRPQPGAFAATRRPA